MIETAADALKWHVRFLELAKLVSSWSKDPSTKIGSVIVRDNIVLGLGYNGFPRGVIDSEDRYNNRDLKLAMVVHAELNAILNSTGSLKEATIYVWPTIMVPASCNECTKAIIQSGIIRIVYYQPDPTKPLSTKWAESAEISAQMLSEACVRTVEIANQ